MGPSQSLPEMSDGHWGTLRAVAIVSPPLFKSMLNICSSGLGALSVFICDIADCTSPTVNRNPVVAKSNDNC